MKEKKLKSIERGRDLVPKANRHSILSEFSNISMNTEAESTTRGALDHTGCMPASAGSTKQ